ncbi:MAG: hydrogenase nickel incorporation protein HypB [Gemmatimonadales bacterium]|nr:hydrogenase nickel incorporation protein HypB [Gemmatimonadales bacterium]
MCDHCGCDGPGQEVTYHRPGQDKHHHEGHEHSHDHSHNHDHNHDHGHGSADSASRTLDIEQDILLKNRLLAERNRGWLMAKDILALNLVSSPGSGKTTLLERTIVDLKSELPFFVIEGDQQTLNDAARIDATGAPVIQINTGSGCHLDAEMIQRACRELSPATGSILMIENVGNLVCPALFDLGESAKVVVISVTEGDDKPLKYSHMFAASDLCLINKVDLLPYVDFDLEKCEQAARAVNPQLKILRISAKTGEGLNHWYDWLREHPDRKA